MEFELKKIWKKMIFEAVWFVAVFILVFYFFFLFSRGLFFYTKTYIDTKEWFVFGVSVTIAVFWIFFAALTVFTFIKLKKNLETNYRMLKTSILFLEKSLQICFNKKSFEIYYIYLIRILVSDKQVLIVWKREDDSLNTFDLRSEYFKRIDWIYLIRQLSQFECFSNDEEQNKIFKIENELNHIFRKNKLEYQL